MADTAYGVNDALAVKLWSKGLTAEVLKSTYAQKFIGTTSKSLIQVKTETSKSEGDKITFGLRMQLTGDGVEGDATLEGNEEALTTYSDSVLIDQQRHAVRSKGKMSEQRVPFNVRQEARDGLADWWADRLDTAMFNHLCGYTPANSTPKDGNNTIVAPSSAHHIFADSANNSTDEAIASSATVGTDTLLLSQIDKAVNQAKILSPAIRPVRVNGKDYYVMFIHPNQTKSLRSDSAAAGSWFDIQKAAMQGGKIADNPLMTGALGIYNGVILHESTRVTQGVNSSSGAAVSTVRRAVLCGAQAGVIAYGRESGGNGGAARFSWVEEMFDYKNKLGVSAGSIYGIKKTRFNSADFATIVVSTYAPDPV